MSIIKANGAGDQSTGFYNNVVNQSLRFNNSANASLSWTPSSAGNRKKWTFSTWVKRSSYTNAASGDQYIFSQATGTNNNDSFLALLFRGDDLDVTSNSIEWLRSHAKFTDTTSWYHILWVLDTQNSTDAHKMRLYVNGVEITHLSTDSRDNSQLDGTDMPILNNAIHYIGRYGGDTSRNFDGYMAYTELVEGEALTPSSFTETKNNILIPKKYTGDHGTYGFRLEYKETGDGQTTAGTGTIGADTKGNSTKQHWNDNNLDAYDSNMPDCPENNFAVMNTLVNTSGATVESISEGALSVAVTGLTYSFFQSTLGVLSGKWYAEARPSGTINGPMIGIAEMNMETYRTGENVDPHLTAGCVWYISGGDGYVDGSNQSASTFSSSTSYASGDVIGLALDLDSATKTIKFYKNGSLVTTKNLTANFTDHMGFALNLYNTNSVIWNFGQDSTFVGYETAATNTDGNGIGLFHHSVPSGYLALCTKNFAEPHIGPNSDTGNSTDFHKAVPYQGNNTDDRAITFGFQPDWIVNPDLDNASTNHPLVDSSRGTGKDLFTTSNTYQSPDTNGVKSFTSTGITIGTSTNWNVSSRYYISWGWKIGGSSGTNTSGSANSTVRVNQNVGMTQVLYTGNSGSSGDEQTIGHGMLDTSGNAAKPDIIIFKSYGGTNSQNWYMYNKHLDNPALNQLVMNSTTAEQTSDNDFMNQTEPTTTVFSLGYNFATNKSGEDYIAYCFRGIDGYSKFGVYTGNALNDGAFVYLGFKPAWLLIKSIDHAESWHVWDNKRSNLDTGYNTAAQTWNTTAAQVGGNPYDVEFTSVGFKIRDDHNMTNGSADKHIYMAFAEAPAKYANTPFVEHLVYGV